MIHEDKKRKQKHWYLYPKFDEWYDELTQNKEEHDDPRNGIPSDAD